jgi:hypothetical protein
MEKCYFEKADVVQTTKAGVIILFRFMALSLAVLRSLLIDF